MTTQIIAQVASGQYGGQSINGIDRILAPFVRKSYEKILNNVIEEQVEIYGMEPNMEKAREMLGTVRAKRLRWVFQNYPVSNQYIDDYKWSVSICYVVHVF